MSKNEYIFNVKLQNPDLFFFLSSLIGKNKYLLIGRKWPITSDILEQAPSAGLARNNFQIKWEQTRSLR